MYTQKLRTPGAGRLVQATTRCLLRRQQQELRKQRAMPCLFGFERRNKSSTASILDDIPVPESIRDAVKSSFLKQATKPDSRFWSQPTDTINGTYAHDNEDRMQQHYDIDSSMLTHDPLDEWYLDKTTSHWPTLPATVRPMHQGADPFQLAKVELDTMSRTIREDLLGTEHPVLHKAASYFFQSTTDGGKKVRPMMVLLLSRALAEGHAEDPPRVRKHPESSSSNNTNTFWLAPHSWQRPDLPRAQRRLAEISELIHTASLFHDDVIDKADTRRGVPAVHKVFGNKMAILAGDYLLARASISLARLRHADVIETMSTIIEHLVRGEVMQLRNEQDKSNNNNNNDNINRDGLIYYLTKNFYKTGSLMANSCKSAALLGNYSDELVDASYRYGKHVGMAFQLVDDVLDFEGSASDMGKPALSDLNAGLATAPVLFAADKHGGALSELMERKFRHDGDVEAAVEMVFDSDGIERTKELAKVHAELAMEAVLCLGESAHRDALVHLAHKVVDRTR